MLFRKLCRRRRFPLRQPGHGAQPVAELLRFRAAVFGERRDRIPDRIAGADIGKEIDRLAPPLPHPLHETAFRGAGFDCRDARIKKLLRELVDEKRTRRISGVGLVEGRLPRVGRVAGVEQDLSRDRLPVEPEECDRGLPFGGEVPEELPREVRVGRLVEKRRSFTALPAGGLHGEKHFDRVLDRRRVVGDVDGARRRQAVPVLPHLLAGRAGRLETALPRHERPRLLRKHAMAKTALRQRRKEGKRCFRLAVEILDADELRQRPLGRDRGEECRHHLMHERRIDHRRRKEGIVVRRRQQIAGAERRDARLLESPQPDQSRRGRAGVPGQEHVEHGECGIEDCVERRRIHEHIRRGAPDEIGPLAGDAEHRRSDFDPDLSHSRHGPRPARRNPTTKAAAAGARGARFCRCRRERAPGAARARLRRCRSTGT